LFRVLFKFSVNRTLPLERDREREGGLRECTFQSAVHAVCAYRPEAYGSFISVYRMTAITSPAQDKPSRAHVAEFFPFSKPISINIWVLVNYIYTVRHYARK
jgi:hypothetical protein